MTRILALDVGKSVGHAVLDGARQDCGTKSFKHCLDIGELVSEFRRWLEEALAAERPDVLALERPFGRASFTADLPIVLAGVAHAAAHEAGVPRVEWTASALKKRITGSGTAKKPQMMAAVRALGWTPDTDHAADAAACAIATAEAA